MSEAMESLVWERSGRCCELCGATDGLAVRAVPALDPASADGNVLLCPTCLAQQEAGAELDALHWMCLHESAWSGVQPVQIAAWRMLRRLPEPWARELADQIWMDDDVRALAEAGMAAAEAQGPAVVDCNGTPLEDGDTVTIIKDLAVKGAGFTAKRGTTVKNIRLGDDPTHVEGRVNKQAIYLKTEFLKKLK